MSPQFICIFFQPRAINNTISDTFNLAQPTATHPHPAQNNPQNYLSSSVVCPCPAISGYSYFCDHSFTMATDP
ncbi:hypothetical protein ACTXT7_013930 [Hymenolepis weldensis]